MTWGKNKNGKSYKVTRYHMPHWGRTIVIKNETPEHDPGKVLEDQLKRNNIPFTKSIGELNRPLTTNETEFTVSKKRFGKGKVEGFK